MPVRLPPLAVDPESVLMAGFSSGSYASNQNHTISSAIIITFSLMNGVAFWSKAYEVP